jgi:hypothetical protein
MRDVTWRILMLILSFCFVNCNLPGSRDSSVGIVTRRRLNGRGIVVPFLVGTGPALVTIQPPIQWVSVLPGVMLQEREAKHPYALWCAREKPYLCYIQLTFEQAGSALII